MSHLLVLDAAPETQLRKVSLEVIFGSVTFSTHFYMLFFFLVIKIFFFSNSFITPINPFISLKKK